MERKPISGREIAMLAAAGALLYGIQVVLAALPNIEGVTLLIILFSLVFGRRVLWSVAMFIMLEGLTYGFGLWWFFYLYVWPLLTIFVLLLKRFIGESLFGWAVFSAAFGLLFGFFYALQFLFYGGFPEMLATWIAGFPFDISHCIGNFLLCIALFKPLLHVTRRLT